MGSCYCSFVLRLSSARFVLYTSRTVLRTGLTQGKEGEIVPRLLGSEKLMGAPLTLMRFCPKLRLHFPLMPVFLPSV